MGRSERDGGGGRRLAGVPEAGAVDEDGARELRGMLRAVYAAWRDAFQRIEDAKLRDPAGFFDLYWTARTADNGLCRVANEVEELIGREGGPPDAEAPPGPRGDAPPAGPAD